MLIFSPVDPPYGGDSNNCHNLPVKGIKDIYQPQDYTDVSNKFLNVGHTMY